MDKLRIIRRYLWELSTLMLIATALAVVIAVIVLHIVLPVVAFEIARAHHSRELYPVDRKVDLWAIKQKSADHSRIALSVAYGDHLQRNNHE